MQKSCPRRDGSLKNYSFKSYHVYMNKISYNHLYIFYNQPQIKRNFVCSLDAISASHASIFLLSATSNQIIQIITNICWKHTWIVFYNKTVWLFQGLTRDRFRIYKSWENPYKKPWHYLKAIGLWLSLYMLPFLPILIQYKTQTHTWLQQSLPLVYECEYLLHWYTLPQTEAFAPIPHVGSFQKETLGRFGTCKSCANT